MCSDYDIRGGGRSEGRRQLRADVDDLRHEKIQTKSYEARSAKQANCESDVRTYFSLL
jgi:hypothetical protein